MTPDLDESIVYRIDESDRIVAVNDAWDRFAVANDAPELSGARILGHSLWESITDEMTRSLYRALITRARQRGPMSFLVRCDTQSVRRVLQMTIAREDGQGIRFETAVAREEAVSAFSFWDRRAPRSGEPIRTCSWCKRIEIGGHWIEVDVAVDVLGLFVDPPARPLIHGTCPSCEAAIRAELDRPAKE